MRQSRCSVPSAVRPDNSGGPERSSFSPFVPNTANPAAINTTGTFSRYSLSYFQQHQFSQEFQAVGSVPWMAMS